MFSIRQDLLQMWYVDLVIPAESNCIPGSVTREKQKKSEKNLILKTPPNTPEILRWSLSCKCFVVALRGAKSKPIIHTDRGCHYRWPGWIEGMKINGYTRSMSQKGCSPDNAACEGLFGRIKNEFFYNQDWTGVTV